MKDLIETSCSFTGHRPEKLPWGENEAEAAALKEKLKNYIGLLARDKGVTRFISGMAPGIDIYAAEAVIELKKEMPGIALECAVPDPGFTDGFTKKDNLRYCRVISQADKITYVCEEPRPDSHELRNRYLVDNSLYLIAVFSGAEGGTMQTINFAKTKGRNIIVIDPATLKTYAVGGNAR